MSDFELMYTFSEAFNGMITLLTTYFSIIFAFVVAAFLAAKKLSRVLTVVSVTLFTVAAALFAILIMTVMADMWAIQDVIRVEVAEGRSSLGWVGFANRRNMPGLGTVVVGLMLGLLVLSYIGALFVFFYQRRSMASHGRAASHRSARPVDM